MAEFQTKTDEPSDPVIYRSVRFPLNPTIAQVAMFKQYAGTARWAFNWALNQWITAYQSGCPRPSSRELKKRITVLKREEDHKWIGSVSNHVPEQAIDNADAAFINFFKGCKTDRKTGFPKFKKKGASKVSFSFNICVLRSIIGRHVIVPKLGPVKISRRHFVIPENSRAIRLTVSLIGHKWVATILYELKAKPFAPNYGETIGVDLGIISFATLSNGEKIDSPRPLRRYIKRLKRLQRRFSASPLNSRRRHKKLRAVARLHARIRNVRQNSIHQLTSRLAKNHGKVVIENLSVPNMIKNHTLAFAIGDSGWGEFSRQLAYKCPQHGSILVIADRWFPSSKTCSSCGKIADSFPLSVRNWTCSLCGVTHDRDINAAINLENLGRITPEITPVEIGVQGGHKTSRCQSMKLEAQQQPLQVSTSMIRRAVSAFSDS